MTPKVKVPDNSKAQNAQLREMRASQKAQADAIAARDEETRLTEEAQARLRLKRRSGLLAFTEDAGGSGLVSKLGG